MLRKLFNWVFKKELLQLNLAITKHNIVLESIERENKNLQNSAYAARQQVERIESFFKNHVDVTVDINQNDRYHGSWAVISIQGQSMDYLKFVDFKNQDIHHIESFLRQFEDHRKIDASPDFRFLRDGFSIKKSNRGF